MKKFLILPIIICVLVIFCSCSIHTNGVDEALIRIHIRANSNQSCDQEIKLKVRDEVTAYLEGQLKGVNDYATAYREIEKRLDKLSAISTAVLEREGYSYSAKAVMNNEYFPTRSYGESVVPSGYYDALIISLGEGKGDNWWCVIYPPLCFVGAEKDAKIHYRSLIVELFEYLFG